MCVYIHSINNIQRYFETHEKNGTNFTLIEKICFILNVGKSKEVYLGNIEKEGNHWTMLAISNKGDGIPTYGDSLGWECPMEMIQKAKLFVTHICKIQMKEDIQCLHDHHYHSAHRKCGPTCTSYPLQTYSNVCGVVACIMTCICSLNSDFFDKLSGSKKCQAFISSPTKYNK